LILISNPLLKHFLKDKINQW